MNEIITVLKEMLRKEEERLKNFVQYDDGETMEYIEGRISGMESMLKEALKQGS